MDQSAPLLIALPHGLNVSGVTVWAVRLVNALAERGRGVGLILHPEPEGQARLHVPLHPDVAVTEITGDPPLDQAAGKLDPYVGHYRRAVEALAQRHGSPVVLSPNLVGDCYGVCAELCRATPELVRVVAWHHSDITYNDRVLAHYEPIIARFVAVSDRIEDRLVETMPDRRSDIVNIPYGVPAPDAPVHRDASVNDAGRRRPFRLIYTGRMDHEQKRVMAFIHMSDSLRDRGIKHTLTLVGDGPAQKLMDKQITSRPAISRIEPQPPEQVLEMLDEADAFVLASRYEGLSVSMLEAMARGCVPVVTLVESGASQVIEPGVNGELATPPSHADDRGVGIALAACVYHLLSESLHPLREAAWSTIVERFSIDRHAEAAGAIVDLAAASEPRRWPVDRPCAFTERDPAHGSGSVPVDGPDRLRRVLDVLADRPVAIHGTGQHTRQLRDVIDASPARVVAFTDDDPAQHDSTLWDRPVIAPDRVSAVGVTDLVISSWMHEPAIWERRRVYLDQGLTVHRLYA
jgi:glycosyltransferase involved in cell wall biosynthesis